MDVKCPHCQKKFVLLSASDVAERFGFTPNDQQFRRDTGRWVKPWTGVENRGFYLEDQIIELLRSRKDNLAFQDLRTAIRSLPETSRDRKALMRRLEELVDE